MLAGDESAELWTAWQALRDQQDASGLRSIALGLEDAGLRAGLLFPSEAEVLMAGFNLLTVPRPSDLPEGSGFRVELSTARAHGRSCWISMTRQPGASVDLFHAMAADVFRHIGPHAPRRDDQRLATLLSRITTWQEFMKRPKDAVLSDDEEVGLFGELSVLSRLVTLGRDAVLVVRCWSGPNRAPQDFQTLAHGLEVKATTSVNGFPARISSLAQLDDGAGRDIFLAATRLALQQGGMTLPALVSSLRDQLASWPSAVAELDSKLLLAGYNPVVSEAYERKFVASDPRVWRIDATFPRLTRSLTPAQILRAEYILDLDALQQKACSLAEAIDQHGLLSQ